MTEGPVEGAPADAAPSHGAMVIDTNIALDLLVFNDPATRDLRHALTGGQLRWLGTTAMRDELARVLDYPKLAARVAFHGHKNSDVLARWDALCQTVPEAAKAAVTCKDPDDQKFLDLAVAHQAILLSKDHHLLCMRKRLEKLGVNTLVKFIK